MEAEVLGLLEDVQSTQEGPRRLAETTLKELYAHAEFGPCLLSIASQDIIPIPLRQAALFCCKAYIQSSWSPFFEEFDGQSVISEDVKRQLRHSVLELATSHRHDRKIRSAATTVVSKIASSDFPDEWPTLLDSLLHTIQHAEEDEIHGPLKVLLELVDDCFTEAQFFRIARELVQTLQKITMNESIQQNLRALAVCVFCSCFNMLEMIMEDNKAAVKGFAEESLNAWLPFFLETLKANLPSTPTQGDNESASSHSVQYRGTIALKLQVVKVLMRVRAVFPTILSPLSPVLFASTWDELNRLLPQYHTMYIDNNYDGRLEDADGLPYSLDFLVLELLDFMQGCLRAPPVRKDLEQRLQQLNNCHVNANGRSDISSTWVSEVINLAASYAFITVEEEGLWNVDANVFLSEEAGVTANYTARSACGELAVKLGDWIHRPTVDALYAHARTLYAEGSGWRAQEAALYVLNQLLIGLQQLDQELSVDMANSFSDFVLSAVHHSNVFLRARGHLVAGNLVKTSGQALLSIAPSFLESSLRAMRDDPSDIVKVSSVQAVHRYLSSVPPGITQPLQSSIMASLADFLAQQDPNEFDENEDIMLALLETLRDTICLDTTICLTGAGLDLLFTLASHGAANFQVATIITETFEELTSTLSASGPEAYSQLCSKVLPSLANVLGLTKPNEESPLTILAADLLATIIESSSAPLPTGFVQAIMPKLQPIMSSSEDEELLKSTTLAVKGLVEHDAAQILGWHDETGKGGLEVLLIFVARLLGAGLNDNAASGVGGLAAALVKEAGAKDMGPHIPQLIQAVAVRLSSSEQATLTQSLISVFAGLALVSPADMLDFLTQINVGNQRAIQVVMSKWLENSINFAGYEEIRQNVIALSRLYESDDKQLLSKIEVKGDLIIFPQSDRIKTRSQARSEPDQYTSVTASLKIIKVLVEELVNASGAQQDLDVTAAAAMDEGLEDEDEGWEDEPNGILDLNSKAVKEQLMAYGELESGPSTRKPDDETQAFLLDFFRRHAQRPGFMQVLALLTPEEQEKLRSMA